MKCEKYRRSSWLVLLTTGPLPHPAFAGKIFGRDEFGFLVYFLRYGAPPDCYSRRRRRWLQPPHGCERIWHARRTEGDSNGFHRWEDRPASGTHRQADGRRHAGGVFERGERGFLRRRSPARDA